MLQCVVFGGSGTYNFTWETPPDSTSLQRGIVVVDMVTIASLTFETFAEDTGTYRCQVNGSSDPPAETSLTVGNANYYIIF